MSWTLWLLAAIVLIVVEIFTAGFLTGFLAIGALAAMVLSLFTSSTGLQIICFSLVSLVAVLVGRPVLQKYFNVNKEVKLSNVDAMIGKTGIVTKEINAFETGLVKISGDTWTAISSDDTPVPADTRIVVKGIDGVKLSVGIFKESEKSEILVGKGSEK
jgi:membrane protein implicated in regulation of membrane protease activity